MNGYLLDTNVLSELVRKRPFEAVVDRVTVAPSDSLFTSSICVMELRYGTARHPQGSALWKRITDEVLSQVTVLPVTALEAQKAGDLIASLEASGNPIGVEDLLIGATALVNGLTAVTRNTKHFDRIQGLRVESWWS